MASLMISDVIELISVPEGTFDLDDYCDVTGLSREEIISSIPVENISYASAGYYQPEHVK